jgi:hypothetical protein
MQATIAHALEFLIEDIGTLCIGEQVDVLGGADDFVGREGESADQGMAVWISAMTLPRPDEFTSPDIPRVGEINSPEKT